MILDEITRKRKIQLQREKSKISPENIKKIALYDKREPISFKKALQKERLSIIAEIKKSSPSKSVICTDFDPVRTASIYQASGADAVSCLTEEFFFNGSSEYLRQIRNKLSIPVLRKDFIIDEYQIYEAKVIGADAILLISALLDTDTIIHFKEIADSLGLECLCEIHNKEELLNLIPAKPEIIGINNRNLRTFNVSLDTTKELVTMITDGPVIVSESGIKDEDDIKLLRSYGVNAVLIGETLMRSTDIPKTMSELRKYAI